MQNWRRRESDDGGGAESSGREQATPAVSDVGCEGARNIFPVSDSPPGKGARLFFCLYLFTCLLEGKFHSRSRTTTCCFLTMIPYVPSCVCGQEQRKSSSASVGDTHTASF